MQHTKLMYITAMIITLIITSGFLTVIHYYSLETVLEFFLRLPVEVYLGTTLVLIILKIILIILRFLPAFRAFIRGIVAVTSRVDTLTSRVDKLQNSSFKAGGKRMFSTSLVREGELKRFQTAPLSGFVQKNATYLRILDTVKPVGAMLSVKAGRPIVNHLLRLVSLSGLGMSTGLVKAIIVFVKFCFKHIKNNGLPRLIKVLKACSVILQQASGRHKLNNMTPLGVRVSRSKTGFPRVIPDLHRRRILSGDWMIIKLWMTLFSIYRVLEMPYKLKLTTITDPSTMDGSWLVKFASDADSVFWTGLGNLPNFSDTKIGENWGEPIDFLRSLRATPFVISKTSAPAGTIRLDDSDRTVLSTAPAGILAAVAAWYESGPYLDILKDWCKATGNTWLPNRLELWNKILIPKGNPGTPSHELMKGMYTVLGNVYARSLGRLGFKEEAAGKLRVFAMVDPFTQWLMKPLHDAIFEVLAIIPQDGTTDQLKPVKRLIENQKKGTPFFSFDLSAATDRLPITIQMVLLSKILTSRGAEIWAQLLTGRPYYYSIKLNNKVYSGSVYYEAGQPMGALSSWAMLALTHHAIVQQSAFDAGVIKPGEWFGDYALLGDDIVIANAEVAREYQLVMAGYGVEIGLAKSLISTDGVTLEFAKRTFMRGHDVSPVPFSEYWVGRQMLSASLELVRKYSLTLPKYLNLFGFGYKAKGSVTGNLMALGRRLRHRVLAYYSPLGPHPLSLKEYFSLKGLSRYYTWTEGKLNLLVSSFVKNEFTRLQEKVNSPEMETLLKFVREISTVNKDREYYGTLSRKASGARKIDLEGLRLDVRQMGQPLGVDIMVDHELFYHVVDSICQTVYREVYLDVLSQVRDLRYALEDMTKEDVVATMEDFERVFTFYKDWLDSLKEIPLPKELYLRVNSDSTPLRDLDVVKLWEKYSSVLRSTLSNLPKANINITASPSLEN